MASAASIARASSGPKPRRLAYDPMPPSPENCAENTVGRRTPRRHALFRRRANNAFTEEPMNRARTNRDRMNWKRIGTSRGVGISHKPTPSRNEGTRCCMTVRNYPRGRGARNFDLRV